MATFTDIAALIPTLSAHLGDGGADGAQASMMRMTDAEVVVVLEETASLVKHAEQIQVMTAGIVTSRSTRRAWHQPLRDALRDGHVASAQFDAIKRGLGEPPEIGSPSGGDMGEAMDADAPAHAAESARRAWEHAAARTTPVHPEAARRAREPRWWMPLARVRSAGVILRSPPHR